MSVIRAVWQQLWITFVTALVMLALYSSLGRQLLPLLENYHQDIEELLQDSLQQPVHIGVVRGSWTGLAPVFTLENIRLGGDQGVHFSLAEVELDVAASLFYRQPVFNQIRLEGGVANITQLSAHEWQLSDSWIINTAESNPEPSLSSSVSFSKWLARQDHIHFHSLALQLNRLEREPEHYAVEKLHWRSLGGEHQLEANISLAKENLSNIQLQASLQGEIWPLHAHNGHLYIEVEHQDWSKWLSIPKDVAVIDSFRGALKGWLEIKQGNLHALFFEADIPAIAVQRNQHEFRLTDGKVIVAGEHSGKDWHLQLRPNFKETLPLKCINLSEINLDKQRVWQVSVPELDLGAAQQLLEKYQALPSKVAEFIDGTAPSGDGKNIRFTVLKDKKDDQFKFDIQADIENLQSTAFHGIPAIRGANAKLHIQKQGGLVELSDAELDLHLQDLYSGAWHLSELNGRFRWLVFKEHVELLLEDTQAKLQELDSPIGWPVTGQMSIALPIHESSVEPAIGLLLGLKEAPISLQQQLVPDLVGKPAQDWLSESLTSGHVENAIFSLQSALRKTPSGNALSALLSLEVADTSLRYLDEWPEVKNISGYLYLDSPSVEIQLHQGETLGGSLGGGGGNAKLTPIADGMLLEVSAGLQGDSSEAAKYFTDTPLQQILKNGLDDWSLSGRHNTDVYLRVALVQQGVTPEVWISSEVHNNRLLLQDYNLEFTKLNGKVSYSSRTGLSSKKITGHLLGGSFSSELNSAVDPQGNLTINLHGQGQAQWKNIKSWQPLFVLEPMSGSLNYKTQIQVADSQVQIAAQSTLLGTNIALPFPYAKDEETIGDVQLMLTSGAEPLLDLQYLEQISAKLMLGKEGLVKGQLALGGQSARLPSKERFEIIGNIAESIDALQWWQAWEDLASEEDEAASASQLPIHANLILTEVDAWDILLGPTKLRADYDENWTVGFYSAVVSGKAWLFADGTPTQLKIEYLELPTLTDSEQTATRPDPWQHINPSELPALDVDIGKISIGEQEYGSWKIASRPEHNGLRIEIQDSNLFDTQIKGHLHWNVNNGQHRTLLDEIEVQGKDIQKLQQGFGLPAAIESKKLTAQATIEWLSSPVAFQFSDIIGDAQVDLREGRIATESGSALKALGVLNINNLSRRLKLDFSDLYKSGLAFDKITADMHFNEQVMTFNKPMMVEGPGGKFITTGSAHFPSRDLDMKVAVVLPVSNNLPLVAILAGLSPPVAASIYITEKLVGDELSRFTTANYDLTGDWQDPDMSLRGAFSKGGEEKRSLGQKIKGIFKRNN